MGNILEGLIRRAALFGREVATGGLHLDEELARPEEIDAALALVGAFDAVFMDGVDGAAVAAEDVEELV